MFSDNFHGRVGPATAVTVVKGCQNHALLQPLEVSSLFDLLKEVIGRMLCACCDATETPVEEVTALPTLTESTGSKVSGGIFWHRLYWKQKAEVPSTASLGPGAVFTFKLPDGTTKEVNFQQKPLGLDFSKSIPMMVKAVKKDSVAEEANIQPKWMVTHVKGGGGGRVCMNFRI
eukprot:Skav226166  [mRNA]  locus=scaffold2279:131637:137397:+ [translate_table: standard]